MTSKTAIMKLNIGGTIFQTTESTLTRYDGFFKTMLETDIPVTKDESGAFFIDRSPKRFDTILNFMRDGDVKLPACGTEAEEISKEAQYYLLIGLMELCAKHLEIHLNNNIFKILNSEDERDSVVLNSKKPVLIVYTDNSVSDLVNRWSFIKWKEFIEKHSPSWNIFFSKAEKHSCCIHYNGNKFPECSIDHRGEKYCCGRIYSRSSWDDNNFIHLEYHMNDCLTHPNRVYFNFEDVQPSLYEF